MDLLDDPGKRSWESALGTPRRTLRIIMEATSEGLACFPLGPTRAPPFAFKSGRYCLTLLK